LYVLTQGFIEREHLLLPICASLNFLGAQIPVMLSEIHDTVDDWSRGLRGQNWGTHRWIFKYYRSMMEYGCCRITRLMRWEGGKAVTGKTSTGQALACTLCMKKEGNEPACKLYSRCSTDRKLYTLNWKCKYITIQRGPEVQIALCEAWWGFRRQGIFWQADYRCDSHLFTRLRFW